ncbi:MAG TPA: hypothetical protein VGE41_02385, partial [Verrucomicrobiae bacterium]
MKVIIQDPGSLTFLGRSGEWTFDPEAAYTFKHSQEAVEYCLQYNLHNVRVVFKFPDNRYDMAVPI